MTDLTAAFLSLGVFTIAFGSPPDSIAFSVTSDKTVYLKGESVKLVLENLSIHDVQVNKTNGPSGVLTS